MALRGRLIVMAAALLAGAAVALSLLTGGSAHAASAQVAAAPKPFTAHVTYNETNHGHQQGAATVGIVGHGAVSGKIGAHAALAVALISLATGVPVIKVAQGGTYVVRRQVAGNGVGTGFVVAKFNAHGLGTICLTYTFTPGKYVPGTSFVPVSGTIRAAGGTGAAATWRGSLGFKQTSLTGASVENIGVSGSVRPAIGAAKPMSAACKQVAKLG
jgi:hypothetical protein